MQSDENKYIFKILRGIFVFYKRLLKLCVDNKTTPTAVTLKLGYTKGSATHWKNGSIPNGDIILKIADYFNVSTDYLLCKTDDPTPADKKEEHQTGATISDALEFYDLLKSIGVKEPDKKLSPKAKERLFKLVKNNADLIIENDDKLE